MSDEQVELRINSPLNLLNRLRALSPSVSPCLPPRAEDIVPNLNEKLSKKNLEHSAGEILGECLTELRNRVAEIRPAQIANVARQMSGIISDLNDRNGNSVNNGIQVVVYAPKTLDESDFDVVTVEDK
jgi:hypothetical protein